jgi:hypothetical protein
MSGTRRTFLATALAALPATVVFADEASPAVIGGLPVLDYGRSFVCGTAKFNNVRFWVESRTVLFDGDKRHEFLQLGSCKSENTFGEKDLFSADNYDFLPILADDGNWLVFRRKNRITSDYRTIKKEIWGPASNKLKFGHKVQTLESFDAIQQATAAGVPLVSRTELEDKGTGLRAIIEAPVKTINIQPDRKLYQVDTGPVALPDLSRRHEPPVDCLRLAFVAFNAPHFADFVIEQPTPIIEDGQERAKAFHYSNPISLPAKNSLITVEDT